MLSRFSLRAALLTAAFLSHAATQDASDHIYNAIRQNDLVFLRTLSSPAAVNIKDSRGGTPLHYAAESGSIEAMRLLIAAGADVNAANAFGATPLMFAAGQPEKAALLLSRGANVNARSKTGRTPLLLAAIHSGNAAIVKMLLDRGAQTGVRDDSKMTPLIAAAYANDTASIRLLIHAGADANERDAAGLSPLAWASLKGNLPAVQLLLARGADVNAVTASAMEPPVKHGNIALGNLTPLLAAATHGSPALIQTLLDAGANVNVQDVRGMTPLMLAVATDRADPVVARLLLVRGADVSKKDLDGLTAAAWAARYNNPAILAVFGLKPRIAPAAAIIPTSALCPSDPHEVAMKAVELLQKTGTSFFAEGGCASCHSHNLASLAVKTALLHHVPVDEKNRAGQAQGGEAQWSSFEQPLLQRIDMPVVDIVTYGLFQFAQDGVKPGRVTDAMIYNIAGQQQEAGNWHTGGIARPPMADGDFTRTALAIRALQVYGAPARKTEFDRRIQRAAAWLMKAAPRNIEDRAMQLLGLNWAGMTQKARLEGIRSLEALQCEDGGWAQTANLPEDAYATGEALYTLHELGVTIQDPVYRRGVDYLLRTAQPDGSWLVKSRAAKIQPYFESGFPYGPDQWISSAGTAWAATALSLAADRIQMAKAK